MIINKRPHALDMPAISVVVKDKSISTSELIAAGTVSLDLYNNINKIIKNHFGFFIFNNLKLSLITWRYSVEDNKLVAVLRFNIPGSVTCKMIIGPSRITTKAHK